MTYGLHALVALAEPIPTQQQDLKAGGCPSSSYENPQSKSPSLKGSSLDFDPLPQSVKRYSPPFPLVLTDWNLVFRFDLSKSWKP
jgi:hypothetical protein